VLRLIGLVVSIGFADSLNPTTIAPALYMATGENGRKRVIEFTLAVFAVFLLGGVAIALGPGQLLLAAIPRPSHRVRHIIEIVVGAAMLVAAAVIWRRRDQLSKRDLPSSDPNGRSGAVLGLTISVVEFPTAFPYFAAIAAIVGSDLPVWRQIMLLVLFNLCFIAPLLGIVAVLTFSGDRAEQVLGKARARLDAHWPSVLAGVALLAGLFVIVLGLTGITGRGKIGPFGRPRGL
jgi:cytochrome c biogenesis protein CcdA